MKIKDFTVEPCPMPPDKETIAKLEQEIKDIKAERWDAYSQYDAECRAKSERIKDLEAGIKRALRICEEWGIDQELGLYKLLDK